MSLALNSIAPLAGPPGSVITLLGSGFSGAQVALVSQAPEVTLDPTPYLLTPTSQTATQITVQIPSNLPGQALGAIDLFVSVVNGDASKSNQLAFSLVFIGWTSIARVATEVPGFKRGGQITDQTILGWIRSRSQTITAAMLQRGYSLIPSAWPANGASGGSPAAGEMLESLNRVGATLDLASRIAAANGAGQWDFANKLRDQWNADFKLLQSGGYDNLFRADSATDAVAPTFGGGDMSDPDTGEVTPSFTKEQVF